jgi:hypothetical protein
MEMVGDVGSGHEALEVGKANASWGNPCEANVKRGKCAWKKPPLFLMGLHTSADKGL